MTAKCHVSIAKHTWHRYSVHRQRLDVSSSGWFLERPAIRRAVAVCWDRLVAVPLATQRLPMLRLAALDCSLGYAKRHADAALLWRLVTQSTLFCKT